MDKITFIIPTIGRDTLVDSIQSIINQTSDNWNVIIIFDGCKNTLSKNFTLNEKISIYEIEKTNCVINQASDVRNYGLQYVSTKWVGFIDDDDTISNDYVSHFLDEVNKYNFDLYIYRMINSDLKIFPSLESRKIIPCDVGISFIVKNDIFKTIKFQNSHCEDYDFINNVKNNNHLIMISNKIKYFIKSKPDAYLNKLLNLNDFYTIFINGINPFILIKYFENII